MNNAASPCGGWKIGLAASVVAPAIIALGMQVGTGGAPTEQYYKHRGERGYSYARYENLSTVENIPVQRTPAENLARIREILRPTVSELAAIFGVSRQTVYNWQNGEQPADENVERLDDLARAADVFVAEGITVTPQLLRRKTSQGKSMFDRLREGGSARSAAIMLAQIVRREANQRAVLEQRLAGREKSNISDSDYGVPMLDERA